MKNQTLLLALILVSGQSPAGERHVFDDMPYTVTETGINYSFRFEDDITDRQQRKQAGLHVLRSVYDDNTIEADFSKAYKRERASCYALDGRFHTYTLCFTPQEFSREKKILKGFVTRVPNWTWQFTHVLLPVLAVVALLFQCFRPAKSRQGIPQPSYKATELERS